MGDDSEVEERYLVMRNVARRFQRNWRLVEVGDGQFVWRQTVGGRSREMRCLPGEVEAVRVLDEMGPL